MDDADGSRWTDMYREVVWARTHTFPWWPSFVYDPSRLPSTCDKSVRDKAKKQCADGKKYVVYFYADHSYGFVGLKGMKPYNAETKEEYLKQVIKDPKYTETFPQAVELADRDIILPKDERVSWHYVAPVADTVHSASAPVADQPIKKRGRKRKIPVLEDDVAPVLFEDPYFHDVDAAPQPATTADDDLPDDEPAAIPEDLSEQDREESAVASESDESFGEKKLKKRGRPPARKGLELKRLVPLNQSTKNRKIEVIKMEPKLTKNRKIEVIEMEPKLKKELKQPNLKIEDTTAPNVEENESTAKRLIRFNQILQMCCSKDESLRDLPRAIRVLDKLAKITVTKQDLIESSIGKTVSGLRKHDDSVISRKADEIKNALKKCVLIYKDEETRRDGEDRHVVAKSSVSPFATRSLPIDVVSPITTESQLNNSTDDPYSALYRTRSITLLYDASGNRSLAYQIEEAVVATFHVGALRYFECIARIALMLQSEESHFSLSFPLSSETMSNLIVGTFEYASEDF